MLVILVVAAAVLLALERATYAFAWHLPERFRALCERFGANDPVAALERLFYGFKAIQLTVFAGWCLVFASRTGWPPAGLGPARLAGLALLAVGQVLNAAVFLRLGRTGVFYGNRFGQATTWVRGFPFALLAHPQYVGAVASIWGVFLVLRFPHPDWVVIPLLETIYYAIGSRLERLPAADTASVAAG